ncbi:hypothetical protein [Catellatospora citrea]|uniref:Uncharacterized protein n=1 Tax=Catellatospora citrea TaxID=53366 RepID=A0A8J3KKV6_9ACTN|nr:hypothetical protein [Catellatospora citrea]RKE09626.1 ABC-type uncharacterized transport system permease subunit [Catellatospora citrea]GIG02795.1 hypothetical protein Cci01nite_78880 [Catellatospora citrea]
MPTPERLANRSLPALLRDAAALALTRWRGLLTVAAAALVPALVAREVIGMFALNGSATIVDGSFTPAPAAAAGGAGLVALALGWVVALVAGIAVAAGGVRGIPVDPRAALLLSLRRLPALVPALLLLAVAAVGLQIVTMLAIAFFDIALPQDVATAAVFGLFVLTLIVLASRLLTVPAIVLSDGAASWLSHAHALAAGRMLTAGGALAIGVVVTPALVGMGAAELTQAQPALALVVAAVAAIIVPAVQAAVLATVYLQRRPANARGAEADLDRVDQTLSALSPAVTPVHAPTDPATDEQPTSATVPSGLTTTERAAGPRHGAVARTGPFAALTRLLADAAWPVPRSGRPVARLAWRVATLARRVARLVRPVARPTRPVVRFTGPLAKSTRPVARLARPWTGRAALAAALASLSLPALLGLGFAAADPWDGPHASRHGVSWSGEVLATAWPAGHHPVVVTDYGPHWCLDDECRDVRSRSSEPLMLGAPMPATAITATGDVVSAGIRGRENRAVKTNGDDAVQMQRCTAPWAPADSRPKPGTCEDGITHWHSGGKEGQSHLAVAAGPDGSVVVATARPLLPKADARPRVQLAVTRCNTVHCNRRSLDVLGTVEVELSAWLPEGTVTAPGYAPLLQLTLDPADRPTVLLRDPAGRRAWLATCPTAACDTPRVTEIGAPERATDQAVLLPGGSTPRLVAGGDAITFHAPVAVAANGPGLYVLGTESDLAAPVPLAPAEYGSGRLVLWHCPPGSVDRARRAALPLLSGELFQAALVTSGDGRVLVTYSDSGRRYAVLVTGPPNPGKGPYCAGFGG